MVKNTTPAPEVSTPSLEAVLSLLNAICSRNGNTLSWYTSKKGRVWITLKGFRPTLFTTSVELAQAHPDQETLDTFLVLLFHHVPKLQEVVPPQNTWLVQKAVKEELDQAIEWALATYRRWQGGEMFWDGSYDEAAPTLLKLRHETESDD